MLPQISSFFRKSGIILSKGFTQNLQYSASHLINTMASAVFGLIYIYLWKSVTPVSGFDGYSPLTIMQYIAFNQTTLWFTQFGIRTHVRIVDAVRSGNIATELIRPMDYFWYMMSSSLGSQIYCLLFRGLPVGFMLSLYSFYIPLKPDTWIWTGLSLALAGYLGIILSYLVGITSFWTTEVRTAWWVVSTLSLGLGGASMPLEVLPPSIVKLVGLSPFPCLTFYPAKIYLELSRPSIIWYSVLWSIVLTLIARWITTCARRRLEVQGG